MCTLLQGEYKMKTFGVHLFVKGRSLRTDRELSYTSLVIDVPDGRKSIGIYAMASHRTISILLLLCASFLVGQK